MIFNLLNTLIEFKNKKVLVIGDIISDMYSWGYIERLNPEEEGAHLIKIKKDTYMLGGAGNVANNISSLGAKAYLMGLINDQDIAGKKIIEMCDNKDIELIYLNDDRPTIIKQRIMSKNRQISRLDREETKKIDIDLSVKMIDLLKDKLHEFDAIIFSDYNKGLFIEELVKPIIKLAKLHDVKLFVDAKPQNILMFKGCDIFTPNLKETEEIIGSKIKLTDHNFKNEIEKYPKLLSEKLNIVNCAVTLGPKGIATYSKKTNLFQHFPTQTKEVYDVSGAGDTVIATLSLAMISGLDFNSSIQLANIAAGYSVSKVGTYAVTPEDIKEQIKILEIKKY